MLKTIAGLPDGVVGVEAAGEVTAQDYDTVLVPAVARGLEGHEKIRFLYQIGREFTGFTAGAMWGDAKVGLHHWKAFEKCAVVADVKWILDSVNLFRVLLPCPVKVFRNDQLAEAKAWLLG
jgi:stage II sporulation SpoAA-like protein